MPERTNTPRGSRRRAPRVPIAPELAVLLAALGALLFAAGACRHADAFETTGRAHDGRGSDTSTCATLRPGTRVILRGHVAASGPGALDAFAFVATSPCTLRYRLWPALPGTDLDLCAVDPASGRVREVSDGDGDEESGTLRIERAGVALELVVSAAWGSSSYTLELSAVDLEPGAGTMPRSSRKHTVAKIESLACGHGDPAAEEPAAAERVPFVLARLDDRGSLHGRPSGPELRAAAR